MTYKKFVEWCNDRSCDGCWGPNTVMFCLDVMYAIKKVPFWKREKIWREKYEILVIEAAVKPIEQQMKEMGLK